MSEINTTQIGLILQCRGLTGWLLAIRATVDGLDVGVVPHKREVVIPVTPGEHTLVCWDRTDLHPATKKIDVRDGEPNSWIVTGGVFGPRIISKLEWSECRYAGILNVPRMHLSTLLLCTIVTGALIGMNILPPFRRRGADVERVYGFPFMLTEHGGMLNILRLAGDLILFVGAVCALFWWLEHRERKSAKDGIHASSGSAESTKS